MQVSRKNTHRFRQLICYLLLILLWLRIFFQTYRTLQAIYKYLTCTYTAQILFFAWKPSMVLASWDCWKSGPSSNGIPKTLEVQSYFIAKLLFWFFPHLPPSKHPFEYHDYHTNISTKHQTFNWCGVRWGNPMLFVIVFLFDFLRRLMASSCFLVPWYQSFQTPVQIPTKIQMVL